MRILVVEDEPSIAGALQTGLEADGYAVDVASDGCTGLELARTHRYAVIVLDLMLPGLNGYLVCRSLREDGDRTPILMLTAKDGVEDQAEGLDTGADAYLTKPFSFPVLAAHIRALIRRGGYESTEVLAVDDLTLVAGGGVCRRGTVEIELTPRELAILEYLLRVPGQVATRTDILSGAWDEEFEGDPNTVDVYIGRLRRKLDTPFGRSNLQTVRGAGYRIAPDPKAQDEADGDSPSGTLTKTGTRPHRRERGRK